MYHYSYAKTEQCRAVFSMPFQRIFSTSLTMLGRAIAKGHSVVRQSVCQSVLSPSVRHTRDPRLNGSG